MIAAAGAFAFALLVIAAFPWGWLQGVARREASERFGRAVTIGSMERLDRFGFTPVIAIRNLRIPQADWARAQAGPGDFAQVRSVTFRLPVWPLLTGAIRPRDVTVDGLHLSLVRDARGRTNWQRPGPPEKGGSAPDLGDIAVRDATIAYSDARRDRAARMNVAIDRTGLRAWGRGSIGGTPVRLAVAGRAPIAARPWAFAARIAGDSLRMRASGTMDRPFDTDRMTLDVTAAASDLKLIDAVIEAGLFRTRPVRLVAKVRRTPDRWAIERLAGTIGRSDLTGSLTVDKVYGRSKIDGSIRSRAFDFNDLTSAEGRAQAAALEARIGPRLVPATRIDIGKIDSTDGRLAFRVGRIVGTSNPPVLDLSGVMTLDHQLLTLAPLRLNLSQGAVTGRAVVDQRGGRAAPLVTFDLTLAGGDIRAFAAGGAFTGRLAARVRLKGVGETIRSAVGRASGTIGFAVTEGQLPARYAAALGFDAGRALTTERDARAQLRCLVAQVAMRGGTGRVAPLVIDTAVSQMTGTGTVTFPDERLALTLRGAPKHGAILRISGTAQIGGRLQAPALSVPPETRSVGNILKAIGRKIRGDSGPVATDADCTALAARALR